MNTITILLADDHKLVRQGLKSLLSDESDFAVVGETGDGIEACDLAERLKPMVLVADVMMPGLSGLDVARQVAQRSPATRTIILSMYANEAYVLKALRNGAAAYVIKEASANELVHAIREVVAGRRYLSPPLSENAIEAYIRKEAASQEDGYEALTGREREVLHLAAEGLNNVEIASRLTVSPRTVETHRANLMHKLGLRNQTDLILFAVRRGILPLDKTVY